jgi:SAM-dependent methyltransferase
VPDAIFADPRLAPLYDAFDPDRSDLDHYLAMAQEFGARRVIDVGCGTGTFACLLSGRGVEVIGVDPAGASLDVARTKPGADRVRWVLGDSSAVTSLGADLVTMTGNVGQVFLEDAHFARVLRDLASGVREDGHVVFEVRDPARKAWESWTRAATWRRAEVAGLGAVISWVDVVEVALPLVTFRWTFEFERSGEVLTSESTLRFRSREEIERAATHSGLVVDSVRDAPDRPGLEFVFVCSRPRSGWGIHHDLGG